MRTDPKAVLEAKLRLIREDLGQAVSIETSKIQQEAAAGGSLRSGPTVARCFQVGIDRVCEARSKMIDAHLETMPSASDAEVAMELRDWLVAWSKAHANLSMRVSIDHTNDAQWAAAQAELLARIVPIFESMEDQVKVRRYDRDKQTTHLDRILRRAKNHPHGAKLLVIAAVLIWLLGFVAAIDKAVRTVRGWAVTDSHPHVAPSETPAPTQDFAVPSHE